MKLAFTTLGCPNWDLDTIIGKAVAYGYDGVDFRGYLETLDIYERPEFSSGLDETVRRFADAGLELPCFSSSARAFSTKPEDLQVAIEEVRRFADLCAAFQTPYIRIFGGAIGETPREEAIDIMAGNLAQMIEAIADYPAQLLIETHDAWTNSRHLAEVLHKVDSDEMGVLWDTHHPCRMIGEDPAATWEALGRWVRNTHWKDSRKDSENPHGYQLCLFGEGDIPLQDLFDCLRDNGYDGYQTLEWEKRWHPEIAEPEEAFPAFVRKMKEMAQ